MTSVSTTKSSSKWLDRLRSSRGFPIGEEPDLDRFLSTSSSGSSPTNTESTQSVSTQFQTAIRKFGIRQNDEHQWILCELFNMGDTTTSRSFSKKKSSRKQVNPRYCGGNENELCSSDDLRREKSENGLTSSGDNSLNDNTRFGDVDVIVEERENVDLKAYSRSDIMVIDTSLSEWKFDGWVFRKNDEWKIKEKKSKSRVFGWKKRKLLVSTLNDENLEKDETKMEIKDKECFLPLNEGQSHNNKKEERFKEVAAFLGKVPPKRFPCPRPPEKLGNEGSSFNLLKSIPLKKSSSSSSSSSIVATKFGNSSRKKRPKMMKIV